MLSESNIIEYKRELPTSSDKLEKEVVSFLNSDGGTIYFGIDDDGNTVGVANPDELQLKLKDRIKNNISSHALDYCSITLENSDDKTIVLLKIESGWEKPFYLNKYGMTPKGCFKRVGSSLEPMNAVQIEMVFSKRVRNSLKNIPSPRSDLTFRQLHIYYEGMNKFLNDRFMQSLNLLTDDGKPNYAAYLLADENRNTVLFAKYADTTRVDLISNELYGDYSLIKSFERLLDRLESENITFTKITPRQRLERKLINETALREAVLNALLHNDYANGSAPKVEFFSDRAEITSNGGLPYGVTEEDFYSGRSAPRNPELMRVFRDLEIVEQLGSGIPRILKAYGKEAFVISDNFIRVILPFAKDFQSTETTNQENSSAKEDMIQISSSESAVLNLIRTNPKITAADISDSLDISLRHTKRLLADLKEKGAIIREGSDKSGNWKIL